MVKTRTATAKYLIEKKDWDLFMVVYTATDKVQHHFWKYIDPTRPESRSTEPHKDAILNVYEEIDRGLGELLQVAGDASVIVMSDHGAGPSSRRTMYINRWLHKEGFLFFADDTGIPGHLGRLKYALLEKSSNRIKRLFPRRAKEILLRLFPRLRDRVDSVLSLSGIDWSRTVAYSRENHPAIFINRVGREPRGIVSFGQQYEDVKKQIIDKLQQLTCPETGRPIVGRTFAFDELFRGPEAEKAPDIVFEWNDALYVHRPSGSRANTRFLETLDEKTLLASENDIRPSGIHRDDGIFVGFGSHFKEGTTISGARIYDVAPTVLYLLGIPVPDDMDGRVLEKAIEKDFLQQQPVEQSVMASDAPDSQATVDFTEDESRDVEERLRGLGYID
jgi:predicted AlkP superfamily phosphohydrolase/phosphomutase